MREEEAIRIVKDIVDSWSRVYINQVFFERCIDNVYQ